MKENHKKTLIFDLDGTLIDSIQDIALCMNKVLESLNLPIYKIEDYKYFVGGGIDILIENALKNEGKNIKEEATKRFKKEYDEKLHFNTKPYEGIYEMLDELKNLDCNLAVLSNKPHNLTVSYVEHFFKAYNFKEIHGQKDKIAKKPNPQAAINIANTFNVPCEEIYFVGDTKIDMQTAKNAKMKAIGVLWGFRDEKELKDFGADFIARKPLDIIKYLKDY